jgi:hypothetical protein
MNYDDDQDADGGLVDDQDDLLSNTSDDVILSTVGHQVTPTPDSGCCARTAARTKKILTCIRFCRHVFTIPGRCRTARFREGGVY